MKKCNYCKSTLSNSFINTSEGLLCSKHYQQFKVGKLGNTREQEIHGLSDTSEYRIWQGMKRRCYTKTHKQYSEYGGRGIIICKEWKDSFNNFYKDMGNRPSDKHSIDRINNDGNYEKSNCRWATRIIQNNNQRLRKDNKSGYKGVMWNKFHKKWQASIRRNTKNKHLGYFDNKEDAINARKTEENIFNLNTKKETPCATD